MQVNEAGADHGRNNWGAFDTHLLHPDGRIGRQQFAFIFVLCIVGFALCTAGMLLVKPTSIAGAAYLVICATLYFAWASVAVQRLHDMGRPDTNFLLTLIPVYNLYVLYRLLFFRLRAAEPIEAGIWHASGRALLRPMALLLLPALLLGVGLRYRPHKYVPFVPIAVSHWYDPSQMYSVDLASGGSITSQVFLTGEEPFSDRTAEGRVKIAQTFGTA